MNRTVDPEFQRQIDQWNQSHPGPALIAVAWHPKKGRWQIWAIPTEISRAPLAKNDLTAKFMRPLPDDSGRRGILLFSWCEWDQFGNDIGYAPLDQRVFDTLHWCDSFRSRQHFEETIKNPELQKEIREKERIRAVAAGTAQYYYNIPNPMVSMNPDIKNVGGDWRSAKWKH